jgi:hypothetical protein
MKTLATLFLSAALAAGLAGCAGPSPVLVPAPTAAPAPACARGQQPMRDDRLVFGTAMPQGAMVSAQDWRGFVDEVVTPRFPDGFTAWPANGQWRPAKGALVREASWVIEVVHWPDAKSDTAIAAIVDEYRKRFHQESVLRVSTEACVTF